MNIDKTTGQKSIRWIYLIAVAFTILSGFTQMPMAKRYYLTSIPGLEWTGNYYITHNVHYFSATLLLIIFAYFITMYFLKFKKNYRFTIKAYVKFAVLAVLTGSGILHVFANLRGIAFRETVITAIDLVHVYSAVVFMIVLVLFAIKKMDWFSQR